MALTRHPALSAQEHARTKHRAFFILHLTIILFSCTAILAKLAAQYRFGSPPYLGYLALELFVLAIYAYFWQQTLKVLPITHAYATRAVAIIWTCLIGILFFHEAFTWQNLIGIVLVLIGVRLVVLRDG